MDLKNTLIVSSVFLLIMSSLSGFSQKYSPRLIDSLQKKAAQQGEDTNKVLTLMSLSNAWYLTDLNKAFAPVNEAHRISEKLHWKRGLANSENNLGMFMSDTGNTIGARQHFEISYKLNVERGSLINVVNNLVNIGRTYSFESDFPRAVDYLFKALTVAEEIHDEQKLALVGNNLASNFLKQHNAQKGFEYGAFTVDHAAKAGDTSSMIKGLIFMGNAKAMMNDTLAAIKSIDSAISIGKKAGLWVDLSDALADKAMLETNLDKRIRMERETEKLMSEVSASSNGRMSMKANLGFDYLELAKRSSGSDKAQLLKQAEENLESARALALARNNPARLSEILRMMVELEKYQGRYREALMDHERMTALNDSLFSQDNKNRIAGLETKHTVASKDAELALSQLKLSGQRKTTIGLIAGLGLLAVIGVLLLGQNRSRKKTNAALQQVNRDLEEANRVKARFFGILSHDLRGPVASLLHFLDIQKEAPEMLNETQQDFHRRRITDSAENLLSTMEGMLLWSKQQMQSFRPNFRPIQVDALFDYLKKFFGEPENINLVFHSAGDIIVFTDENYLRTIMQNLSSNAIRALSDRRDGLIEWKGWKNENHIVFSIADNGPGIGPEHAKILYEESVTENAREGFGLHMIRDLAKAIHCRVDLETHPGKGSAFLLTISDATAFTSL